MNGSKYKLRVAVMIVIIFAFIIIYCRALYDIQIVNGARFLEESENKITQTSSVLASRGEILDRNGNVLVSNRISYNIKLNTKLMSLKGSPNGIILKLIEICSENDVEHTDNLPISAPPFTLNKDLTTSYQRFQKYVTAKEWDNDLSAEEYMKLLKKEYGIAELYSDDEARLIAGVRYELDLRKYLNIPGYIFADDVNIDLISKIKENSLSGVEIVTSSVREYHTKAAAHVLGRVGPMDEKEFAELKKDGYEMDDIIGKEGAEKAFESYLRGTDGVQVTQTNSDGKTTNVLYSVEPKPGKNVVLTLDIRLQEFAEKTLESAIKKLREKELSKDAKGGAIVVLKVDTADVLAMASYPSFNLESFSSDFSELIKDPLNPLLNRSTQGTYEPGSTLKMAVAAAALQEGIITDKTKITDKGIYTYYAPSYTPICWIYKNGQTHGAINVTQALEVSCNYFFYEIGRLTGIEHIGKYAKMFGLGEKTGIELPESTGILAGPAFREKTNGSWQPGDTIQAAIGQSDNAFTPLQIAGYVASLANGGNRYKTHVLSEVKSYDYSGTVYRHTPELLNKIEISQNNLKAILEGMRLVAETGTASSTFGGSEIKIGAKTGTAQTGAVTSNAVFVCFAPYENPEIAIAVVVEQGNAGSSIAGIAKDIIDYYYSSKKEINSVRPENTLLK